MAGLEARAAWTRCSRPARASIAAARRPGVERRRRASSSAPRSRSMSTAWSPASAPDTGWWCQRSARSCWRLRVPALVRRQLHRRRHSPRPAASASQAASQFGNATLQSYMCVAAHRACPARRPRIRRAQRAPGAEDLNVVLLIARRPGLRDRAVRAGRRVGVPPRPIAARWCCSGRSPAPACSIAWSIRRRPPAACCRCRCARAPGWRCSAPWR